METLKMNNLEQLEKEEKLEVGNSKPLTISTKRDSQATKWCFTWNNYPEDWMEQLEQRFLVLAKEYVIGIEVGVINNTPHLQGYIMFKSKLRFSQLKEIKEIHWEKCNNRDASIRYCSKEGNYIHHGIKLGMFEPPMEEYNGEDLPKSTELYDWQNELLAYINGPVKDREILWIYDRIGNSGKSRFSKYLTWHHGIFCFSKGKYSDIINLVYNMKSVPKTLIFDLPRNNGNSISYDALESIKNGSIMNTKYETGSKMFRPPHIIVFANTRPDIEKLSLDRWTLKKIVNKSLVSKELE